MRCYIMLLWLTRFLGNAKSNVQKSEKKLTWAVVLGIPNNLVGEKLHKLRIRNVFFEDRVNFVILTPFVGLDLKKTIKMIRNILVNCAYEIWE